MRYMRTVLFYKICTMAVLVAFSELLCEGKQTILCIKTISIHAFISHLDTHTHKHTHRETHTHRDTHTHTHTHTHTETYIYRERERKRLCACVGGWLVV